MNIRGIIKSGFDWFTNITHVDAIMRLPRPAAFFLITLAFVIGWFHPITLLMFAKAISALPDQFWSVVFIILGSLSATKFIRDIKETK